MAETWYEATFYGLGRINPVTVVNETDKQITIQKDSRHCSKSAKQANYVCYFKTIQEAKEFLLAESSKKVAKARENLEYQLDNQTKLNNYLKTI